MFGRKKKEKEKATTYVDGQRDDETSVPVPEKNPENATALEPEQVPAQEPPHSQEGEPEPVEIVVDCLACRDYGWYIDSIGVWHHCPRCNPKGALNPTRIEKDTPTKKATGKAKQKKR